MKFFLTIFFIICLTCSQAQHIQWAQKTGQHSGPELSTNGTLVAYSGPYADSIVIAGQTLPANGTGFIKKTSAYLATGDYNGNYLWSRYFHSDSVAISDSQVDAFGNIIICGIYRNKLVSGLTLFNNNTQDLYFFIIKYSTAGNIIWAKSTGYFEGSGGHLDLDNFGNIYCSGSFKTSLDIDGVIVNTAPGDTGKKGFLLSIDPWGTVKWGTKFGISLHANYVNPNVVITRNGDIYASCFYTSVNGQAYLVYKFNNVGTEVYVKTLVTGSTTFTLSSPVIKADRSGNIYLSGFYPSTINFPGISGNIPLYFNTTFLAKMNSSGAFLWARDLANWANTDSQVRFSRDDSDTLTMTGKFNDHIILGGISFPNPSNHFPNIFVSKVDGTGTVLHSYTIPSIDHNWPQAIVGDRFGNNLISGTFHAALTIGGINFTAPWLSGFVARYLEHKNEVTGKIYLDANANGTWDPGEVAHTQSRIGISPGNLFTGTNPTGVFQTFFPAGTFTLTPVQNLSHYTFTPHSHTVTFPLTGQTQNKNFGLTPIPNRDDIKISVTNLTPARPGFTVKYRITIENTGTTILSDSLTFQFSQQHLTYLSTSEPPVFQNSGTLTWVYPALAPMQIHHIDVQFQVNVSTPITTQLQASASVKPVTDFITWNNTDTLQHPVTGSFDPNDKNVNFASLTPSQAADTALLNYIIRFQNTGNDTAFTVIVRDSINSNLNMATFELISASHPNTFRFLDNGMMEWRFDNILLPDSNRNELGSHGFIRYRVQPKTNLVLGDEIKARARIYFDYNAPVMTNYAVTRIQNPTGIKEKNIGLTTFNLYPNPAQDFVMVEVEFTSEMPVTLKLTNLLCQQIFEKQYAKSGNIQAKLETGNLTKGVYLLSLQTEKGIVTKRLVIQ